ncbi:hypothetical protein MFLAVUS_009677 [Mucor flavus]|uniref:Uncharacterized protein n=1 Tax=Mucor flavus TaxID=439312 RepID=A0ABP9ZAQ2_9FUNG
MSVCNMPLPIKDDLLPYPELSNYSLQHHDSFSSFESSSQRKIQVGDGETLLKQLYNQIEQLSLSNARLVRANRTMKLDCDKIIQEKTTELKQALNMSVEQNIRLQRSNRLLKDDYQIQSEELNNIKTDQIRKMKQVGPEYEYLVQVIHLLYKQLAGKSNCKETCCFTDKPTKTVEHTCRPIVKSHIQSGSMASHLEQENNQLRDGMDILMNDRDALYQLLKDKEEDNQTLKHELQVKDDIVKQLENDFEKMELEVTDLQKDWCYNNNRSPDSTFSELHSFPSVPITNN